MSRPAHIPDTVESCTLTRSGDHLIITKTHKTGRSDEAIKVGARVRINNGVAKRVGGEA